MNKCTFLVLSSFYLPIGFAQEQDIFELSLEQLINMPVAVAATGKKTQVSAPASVTVYDQSHLQQLNRYSLAELADVTPGYASYEIYGEKVFISRGQKAGSFENNKHLVMVDGIAVNHARSNKAPTDYELPLFFADKVEFMRGPDSALHGVGAFYGVVNIQSKTQQGGAQQYRYSQDQQDVMFNSQNKQQGLYAGYQQQQASLEPVGPNFSSQQLYRDQQRSQFLYGKQTIQIENHSLQLGLMYLARRSGLGEHWTGDFSFAANDLSWTTSIAFVKYQHMAKDAKIEASLQINQGTETGYVTPFSRDEVTSADGTGNVFSAYNVSVLKTIANLNWSQQRESLQWQLGLSYDESHNQTPDSFLLTVNADNVDDNDPVTTPYLFTDVISSQVKNYALHGNGELELWGNTFSVGARYDHGHHLSDSFDQLSPRFSMVRDLTNDVTFKLSYRSALRSPGLKEYTLNSELISQLNTLNLDTTVVKKLEAETFTNFEMNLVLTGERSLWQLNIFQNTTKNVLDSSQLSLVDNNSNTLVFNRFTNDSGKVSATGAEVEARYYFDEHRYINANLSYARAEDDAGDVIADVPDWSANIWFNQKIERWSFTPLVHYQHAYYGASQSGDGILSFDINGHYQFTKQHTLSFGLLNATNEKNYYSLDGEDRIPLAGRVFSISYIARL